jgi:hypothetical protein
MAGETPKLKGYIRKTSMGEWSVVLTSWSSFESKTKANEQLEYFIKHSDKIIIEDLGLWENDKFNPRYD